MPTPVVPTAALGGSRGADPSRRAVLEAVVRSPEPPTVAELAEAVGLHGNSVRAHLRELIEEGLVAIRAGGPGDRVGRGRPSRRYAATAAGAHGVQRGSVGGESSESGAGPEYLALAAAFATRLAARAAPEGAKAVTEEARDVGRLWAKSLPAGTAGPAGASGAAGSRADVIHLMGELGFGPESDGSLVRLTTCPILDVARRSPEVVCQVHAGLVEGVLARSGGAPGDVTLIPFAERGACHLSMCEQTATVDAT